MKQTTSPVDPALLTRFKFLVWLGLLISLSDLGCMLMLGEKFPPHLAGLVLIPALCLLMVGFHVLYQGLPRKERRWSRQSEY